MLSAAAGGVLGCKESLDLRDKATNSRHLGSVWLQAAALPLVQPADAWMRFRAVPGEEQVLQDPLCGRSLGASRRRDCQRQPSVPERSLLMWMICHAAGVSAGWGAPAYEAFCTWMLVPGQASALVVPDARQDSRCCLGACLCLP